MYSCEEVAATNSSREIPITQQGGMMQLPIRSSAGGGLTAQCSRDENRDDGEKGRGRERGMEEEEGYWEWTRAGGKREALGMSC